MTPTHRARFFAIYLPQFHPIPENDNWWGKGFTEWTNVAKAKPLFPGHYQPRLPADLGFYDLRVPETRMAQAEMAKNHGIEGFVYWHYWFAGKRLLERPFNEVLNSGEPDFPFCLAWANATWSGIWHGAPEKVLIEQTYPGMQDYKDHFYAVLDAFTDDRYLTIDGRPVFFVYHPNNLPDSKRFTDYWRELAAAAGLKGIYFIGIRPYSNSRGWIPEERGYDAALLNNLLPVFQKMYNLQHHVDRMSRKLTKQSVKELLYGLSPLPRVMTYKKALKYAITNLSEDVQQYPALVPNFDNTPRTGSRGAVFLNSTPELFRQHIRQVVSLVEKRPLDQRVVVIRAWNEWAEGNYLEPDLKFGRGFLEVIRDANLR